jgi:dienelactone hydrolase
MLKIALQAIWLAAVGSVLLPALGIAAGRPDDPAELERVWQKTIVVFPQEPQVNSWTAASLAEAAGRLDLKAPLPAVVFLHGCAGIGPVSSQVLVLARSLAEAGFVVFAPDGLARPRHSYCDPKTHKSSISRDDVLARIAEGRATLQRIKALPWIDSDNIFLMGHSMGGMTVANYPYDDFRGYVISGYHCNLSQDSRNSGVKLPKQKPILAIRGADDEWFAGSINERATCGDKMRDYPHAHSLNLPGGHHEIYYLPEGAPRS